MSAIHDLQHEERETAGLIARLKDLCGDDEQAFLDTLDGESDVIEAARRTVRWMNEQAAYEAAMKGLADTYAARSKVFAGRVSGARVALFHFLQRLGMRSMALPEATLSIANGRQAVAGDPVGDDLPDDLVRVKREPDLTAILAALKAGQQVPGCSLSNGAPTLTVRKG
jgi:hypothetical protein